MRSAPRRSRRRTWARARWHGSTPARASIGKYVGVALFAAFCLSLVPSLGLLMVKGLRARKIGFPFGPFLAFGAIVGLMWGEQIWNWYML